MADQRLIEIGQRLAAAVRNAGGLSVVSQHVSVSSRSISRYMTGEAEMPILAAEALAAATNVSLKWLLSGEGPAVAMRDEPSPAGLSRLELAQRDDGGGTVYIPLSNAVASAGLGIANDDEQAARRLPFSLSLLRKHGVAFENARFVTARGDSMEPTIADGSIVLIDISRRELVGTGIFVLVVDDALLIKRVSPGLTSIRLMSDNKTYPDEVVGRHEIDRVNVVGRVFWIGGPA